MSRLAVIHGVGLVGGSVGMGLRSAGWTVRGSDPGDGRLEEALRRGAIEAPSTEGDLQATDLLVLAAPPETVAEQLSHLSTPALVTDVAGVKEPIVAAASSLPRFVGGHPMAGGTSAGPELASGKLFHGATWVLTSDGARSEDLNTMAEIVKSLGANPVVMTAAEHDRSVAVISHLPHLLAAALVNAATQEPGALGLAGGGFRDLTRVASSESTWWSELLTSNRIHVREALERLHGQLDEIGNSLDAMEDVDHILSRARYAREAMVEQQTRVGVILLDQPGEIARVGRALEHSRVDVRDFQLRHGEHGGGGILTITVTPAGESRLRAALIEQGFTLQP